MQKNMKNINQKKKSKIDTHNKGFPGGSMVKNLPAMQDAQIQSLVGKIPGEGNGNCSIFAWRIPWTEEPSRLQSMGPQDSNTA